MTPSQAYQRYKEILDMEYFINQEKEQLKPLVVKFIESNGDDNIYRELNYHSQVQSRISYEYSGDTQRLEKRLKKLKKQEEKEGIAIIKNVTNYPVIRCLKRRDFDD